MRPPRRPAAKHAEPRPDIVFEDFQKETYEGWDGDGRRPSARGRSCKSQMPAYQGDVGGQGQRVVNSHASAPGNDVAAKDASTGTLTSKPFTIERNYISFWIGGGNHPGKTCINLLVDGKSSGSPPATTATRCGRRFVRRRRARRARRPGWRSSTRQTGPWGNIGVGQIVFTDKPADAGSSSRSSPTSARMGLALLEPQASGSWRRLRSAAGELPKAAFAAAAAGRRPVQTSRPKARRRARPRSCRWSPARRRRSRS